MVKQDFQTILILSLTYVKVKKMELSIFSANSNLSSLTNKYDSRTGVVVTHANLCFVIVQAIHIKAFGKRVHNSGCLT